MRRPIRPAWGGVWREKIFGISAEQVRFAPRGFPADVPGIQARLERAGSAFVDGYNLALRYRNDAATLDEELLAVDRDLHGFSHEGAAMALAIIDLISPWSRSRWRKFLDSHRRFVYLILIGSGWAMARLFRRSVPLFVLEADPILWPLVYDGLGFHQGFFHPAKYVRAHGRAGLEGYAAKGFDHGLGRSLWFVEGASPARIGATIDSFERARHGDLWSGVGIACTYAGGLDREGLSSLAARAGGHACDLAQGAAFAAKARVEGGHVTPATELACDVLWSADADTVARFIADDLEKAIPEDDREPRYEAWRRLVRHRFTS